MVKDVCVRASTPERLDVAVAVTTDTVRAAQRLHGLRPTSVIALGRLLTGAGLIASTSKVDGKTSLQVLSRGRTGQMFVDATHEGDLRGLIAHGDLAFPLATGEPPRGRRSVGAAVQPGELSAVRRRPTGEYFQSMTPLQTGEVDSDLQSFLERSDQVPTLLVADVLLDREGHVERAGGVLVQALPDADRSALAEIRRRLAQGGFAQRLAEAESADALLAAAVPSASRAEGDLSLRWHCPCSRERAENAVRLMGEPELARIVVENQPVEIDCDFCRSHYELSTDELATILTEMTTAQA